MSWQAVVPGVITYSALINACEKGKQPERALEVFEAVKRQGVVPNTITYSTLISACEKGKQPEQALEHFEAMKRQGMVPNVITYMQRLDQRLRKGQAGRASPEGLRGNGGARCGSSCSHLLCFDQCL